MKALVEVMDSLNSERVSKEQVKQVFRNTHRTIQQLFMKQVILPILIQLADDYIEGRFDLRNEASAALAAKMLRAVDDKDLYLPYV